MKKKEEKPVVVIGYSGHAYVVIDILRTMGRQVAGYCDQEEKRQNPCQLAYLGREAEVIEMLKDYDYFPCVGHNGIREKIFSLLSQHLGHPINAVHPGAVVAASAQTGSGVMIAANATLNPLVKIGDGVICNTACTIDHECIIGDFVHIAPGAVLCGDVKVGRGTFVGANAVIHQGISIGNNVTIGAGTVVIRDIPDNATVIGNPAQNRFGKPVAGNDL